MVTQKSRFRGVQENVQSPHNPYKAKWRAVISVRGKSRNLIYTDDEEKAAREYDKWAKYYHKDKAKLNFPDEA